MRNRGFSWILFPEIRDIWIGIYWKHTKYRTLTGISHDLSIYVCLIPCLPLKMTWWWRKPWAV